MNLQADEKLYLNQCSQSSLVVHMSHYSGDSSNLAFNSCFTSCRNEKVTPSDHAHLYIWPPDPSYLLLYHNKHVKLRPLLKLYKNSNANRGCVDIKHKRVGCRQEECLHCTNKEFQTEHWMSPCLKWPDSTTMEFSMSSMKFFRLEPS